jgi:hypothetical protein
MSPRRIALRHVTALVATAALLTTLLAAIAAPPASAVVNGPGRLDPTFGGGFHQRGFALFGNGTSDSARAVAQDAAGNVWLAGNATLSGTTVMAITKVKPDGSYGGGDVIRAPGVTESGDGGQLVTGAVYDKTRNRFFVAGYNTLGHDFLMSYKPDGTQDTTGFATNGVATNSFASPDGTVGGLAQDPVSGDLVIAAGRNNTLRVARYSPAGVLRSTFGTNGIFTTTITGIDIQAVAFQGSNIIVAGSGTSAPHTANTPIVGRLVGATGAPDSSFAAADGVSGSPAGFRFVDLSIGGAGAYTEIGSFWDIAISSAQKIAATGWYRHTNTGGTTSIEVTAVFNANGTPDTGFTQPPSSNNPGTGGAIGSAWFPGFFVNPTAAAWQPDGKLLVGALANGGGLGGLDFAVARRLPSGAFDNTFGEINGSSRTGVALADLTANDNLYAMALQPDGKILMAGDQATDFLVGRLVGDAPQPPQATDRVIYATGGVFGDTVAMDVNGAHAYTNATQAGSPTLSADGLRMGVLKQVGSVNHIFTSYIDGSSAADVSVVSDPSSLCNDQGPDWSPDGRRFAFARDCGSGFHLWLMNADGTGAAQLNGTGTTNTSPSWSPDGAYLAFSRSPGPQIFKIDVSNGNETLLTNNAFVNMSPTWSSTNKIAFWTTADGGSFRLLDPNGPLNNDTVFFGSAAQSQAEWTADGTKLVVAGNLHNFGVGEIGTGVWVEPVSPPETNPLAPTHMIRIHSGAAAGVATGKVATVGVGAASVPASPTSIPTSEIPLQPSSPAVKAAANIPQLPPLHLPIPQLPVLHLPIAQLPVLHLPLVQLPVLHLPLLQLPVLHLPLLQLPVLHLGLGFYEVGNPNDLGGSPLVQAGFKKMLLAETPVIKGDDWPARLQGTVLANRPLTSVTLADVLAIACAEDTTSNPCPAGKIKPSKLPTLGDFDLNGGGFGKVATLSLMMGDTRLSQIGVDANGNDTFGWCAKLEAIGYANCGAALGVPNSPLKGRSASILSLQIAGVDVDKIDGIRVLKMKDVGFRKKDANGFDTTAGYAPLPNVDLKSFDMHISSVGSIKLVDLPNLNAVIDCSQTTCPPPATATLDSVGQAAIRSGAVITDLGATIDELYLQEVSLGSMSGNQADDPFALPHDKLGILGYSGPGSTQVNYHIGFAPVDTVTGAIAKLHLTNGFRYQQGSTQFSVAGAPFGNTEPVVTALADGNIDLTWQLPTTVTATGLALDFVGRPGLRTGATTPTAADLTITGTDVSVPYSVTASSPRVNVTPNLEAGDGLGSAITAATDTIYFGYLDHPNDRDYFKIPAPPEGSRISVFLNNCNCDADVLLYHPAQARPHTPLRPVSASAPVQQGLTDDPIPLARQGEPLAPEALNDLPIANLPIAAGSTNRGKNPEQLTAVAWGAPAGSFYTVQVSGYNGQTSADAYDLHITVTPPVTNLPTGNARAFTPAGAIPATPAVTRDYKTVILTAPTRLRGAYGDARATAALNKVNDLAANSVVDGLVVPVDSFADVRAAFGLLDAKPSDAEMANDVVRLINTRVDGLLGAHRAAVKSIVLMGSDELLPMSRIPDLTETANERTFAQELLRLASATGNNNALLGAGAAGDILSDDAYGAFAPKPYLGTYLYTPNVALGRLIESPEDMVKIITSFLTPTATGDAAGILRPSNKLVTGYDFMTNMANAIKDTLNSQFTNGQMATLIRDDWTFQDLKSKFTQANPVPDILSVNAHYDPTNALPAQASATADVTDLFTTADVNGVDLTKRILFTIGCHSGLSITDFLANGGGTNTNDWPQAALANGVAAMVANTGYGLAMKDTIAFSAQLMVSYAENMSHMSLGQALTQAKQSYLEAGVPNVYDYKAMAEATFFGLPDFRVSNITPAPAPPAPPPTSPDGLTGLQVLSVPLPAGSFTQKSTSDGSYLEYGADKKLMVAQNRPIQPRVDINITQPAQTAMGAIITALTSNDTDLPNFNPVLARPVIDNSANEPEAQFSNIIFPATLEDTSTFQAADGSQRQNLVVVPAQFQAAPFLNDTSPVTGLERKFTQVDSLVYYAPGGTAAAAPPVFSSVAATKGGGTASFDVSVADPNAANTVMRVLVLWHATGASGPWTATELSQAPTGNWLGNAPTSATEIEYFVQAVSSSGAVGRTTNKGDLYQSVVALPPSTATFTINGTAVNGWYGDGTTVTLHGAPSFTIQIDGVDQGTIFDGGSVAIHGDGRHVVTYSSSAGNGNITVPVDTAGPNITAAVAPQANGAGWNNTAPVTVTFACTDTESGVAPGGCPGPQTFNGSGTQNVTATDNRGNTTTTAVAVKIDAQAPTITASPTNTSTWRNAPVVVTFSCGDTGGSGLSGACPPAQTVGPNQVASASVLDVAGNAASVAVGPFNIDTQAPTISASPDANAFYNGPVSVTFTCNDTGGSGVATCPAGQTVTPANPSTTPVTVTDVAGNATVLGAILYKFDTVKPTITPSPDPANWYNGTVTVSFACADTGGSGLAGTCPANQSVTAANPTTTAVTVGDNAGNSFTLAPITYKFDTVKPTITATVTSAIAPNAAGWYRTDPTVTFTCADTGGSGVASCSAPVTISTDGAAQTVSGTVTDNSGNTNIVFVTLKVDKTPPNGTMDTILGLFHLTLGGAIPGTASDNLSGVKKVVVTYTNALLGGTTTYTASLGCNPAGTGCTWTTPAPGLGLFNASVITTDVADNVDPTAGNSTLVISL